MVAIQPLEKIDARAIVSSSIAATVTYHYGERARLRTSWTFFNPRMEFFSHTSYGISVLNFFFLLCIEVCIWIQFQIGGVDFELLYPNDMNVVRKECMWLFYLA